MPKTRRHTSGGSPRVRAYREVLFITSSGKTKRIEIEEAEQLINHKQAEVLTDSPPTIRALDFPDHRREQRHLSGHLVTGASHCWNRRMNSPQHIRVRPPADRFSQVYLELKQMMKQREREVCP